MKTIGNAKDPELIEQLKLDAQAFIDERVGQAVLDLTTDRPDWFGAIFEKIDAVRLLGP